MGTYAVTGGASGIGAAICEQLRAEGHQVIAADIKGADVNADLSTEDGRQAAIAGIRDLAPDGLDGFVPCAGLAPVIKPPSLVAKVNFFGALATIEGLKQDVAKKRGSMVIVSSNSAPMASDAETVVLMLAGDEKAACERIDELGDGHNAYVSSKMAITRWMRRHTPAYASDGIRLNAVAPGHTETALTQEVEKDPQYGPIIKDFVASIPVGRPGRPEDISNAVCYMLSEKASFMAGAVMFVDGGHDAMLRPDQF